MKLSSEKALELLEEARKKVNEDRLIKHSICVGNTAAIIAKELNLDEDYAKTLGYIHDIGKMFQEHGGVFPHAMNGYNYIKELGYDEDYAGICIKHSFLNNDIDCISNDRNETDRSNPNYEFVKNYIKEEYSIYEKIINLCDLMCTTKVLTVDKRMMDLLIRHGIFKKTYYHIEETLKLKKYFDDLLGYNLYNLFPEIKENL